MPCVLLAESNWRSQATIENEDPRMLADWVREQAAKSVAGNVPISCARWLGRVFGVLVCVRVVTL